MDDENFHVKQFKRFSNLLTESLVRGFRVTKTANIDATLGVFRELSYGDRHAMEEELGLCCVIEARVAPDHAKIDGLLGPRTVVCDIVLCLGQQVSGGFKFAFALTRGRIAVIKAVLDFLRFTFRCDFHPATVAPHHLVFLAREWTRDLDEDDEEDESVREEGRKFKRLARLEMVFSVPPAASVPGTIPKPHDIESIHLTVEEDSLMALHQLVEKGDNQDGDSRVRKDPALVSALAKHITKHINIDLTGAGVTMIVTPTAELSHDGKVRFLWPAHLKRALLQLQEVSKPPGEQLEY